MQLKFFNFALFGALFSSIGLFIYILGVLFEIPRHLLFGHQFRHITEFLVWYSGIPLILGISMILLDLLFFYNYKRINNNIKNDDIFNQDITVVLTAYNDEESIGLSVLDFIKHPMVKRVLVVSNNSKDRTIEIATQNGAIVFNELIQGYGACVFRSLYEAIQYNDTDLIVLCEGDMTFRASDINKLLSYISHADIVVGSRTVEQLRAKSTQLTNFMFYGNLFVAKLLEIKHLGFLTLTDVGSTYKLCRRDAIQSLITKLNKNINLEFNPYFIDRAIQHNLRIIECPITFHKRVGNSKGGNVDNFIAFKLGMKMMMGIFFYWKD